MEHYLAPHWMIGGNVQTIWPALFSQRYVGGAPNYRRERWPSPDGDFLDVDWQCDNPPTALTQDGEAGGFAPTASALACGGKRTPGERPLLVLFHGLEGSSASHYAHAFADWARANGWRFAVPHFRGCSGEVNLAPRAYHSGDFEEIAWVLARMRNNHHGPIAAVGVSLGGNALLRWAEEAGESAAHDVACVCAVSSPVDLTAGGRAIGTGFNRQVYTRLFLRTMKPKALLKWDQFPGLFDRDALHAARSLYDYDNVFTAPVHRFRDTDDYWARASAKPGLDRICIPALVLNARNDPFVPASSLPRASEVGSCVTLWQPLHGGHVGFAGGRWPGPLHTLPEQVMEWIVRQI